jgi:4-aminobutyrate aminotransferase
MKNKFSRREVLGGIAGFTSLSFISNFTFPSPAFANEEKVSNTEIKISPPGPNSIELLERMQKVIGRTNYSGLYGITLYKGNGVYITDVDGNTYLDCLTAASSNILGYSYDEVAKAYYNEAIKLQNSCLPYSPNIKAIELAENLIDLVPGNHPKKVLIGLSGSDSCEGAIEAMRKYTGKTAIIKFANAYHGSTGLSQQASGFRTLNSGIYPASSDFINIDYPITKKQSDVSLNEIKNHLKTGKVGGLIIEAIQGDAGIRVPFKGFIQNISALLKENDALLIVDEVQSGMGRTGNWWAIEHEHVVPDILVTAKGLSAGYAPISAVIGRKEIIDALEPAQHLFTFTGHSPSAAVALKVISILKSKNIINNSASIGEKLINTLKRVQSQYPQIIKDVRGRGLMIGMEINIDKDPLACKIFAMRCVEKGVYVGYFGDKQQVVRIQPPLILNNKESELVANTLNEVAAEMANSKIPKSTKDKVKKFAIGL